MEPADIIGKQIIGFKFEGGPGWNSSMHRCIGKVGTILKGMHPYCYVIFEDNSRWSYPYPEILDHLVEKEEEQTIEQILNNMKKLTEELWKQKI